LKDPRERLPPLAWDSRRDRPVDQRVAGQVDDEVDLLYAHPTEPVAFEIASSPNHGRGGLRRLMERHPRFIKRCYLVSPESPVLPPDRSTDGIGTLPLDMLLLAIGAQAERELTRRVG